MSSRLMSAWRAPAIALLVSLDVSAQTLDSAFSATPSPQVIDLVARESRGQRAYLTTSTGSWLVRIGRVGPEGLTQLSGPADERVPSAVAWEHVASIERRTTHQTAGRWIGTIGGAVAGYYLITGHHEEPLVQVGKGAAAIGTGFLLGGAIGGRVETAPKVLYTGRVEVASPRQDLPAEPADVGEIDQVRAHADELLRVRGSFGTFVGHVSSITDEGLSGLEPRRGEVQSPPTPPNEIRWSQVSNISRRVGHGTHGAVVGATLVGLGGAAIGAAMASPGLFGGGGNVGAGAAAGAAAGVVVGGLVGAMIGSSIHGWHAIYPDR